MLTSAIPPHQAGLAVVESRCPTHLQARLQRQDPARVTPRHTGRRYRRERVLQDWVLGTAHHDHVQPGHIRRRRSQGIPQHRLPTRPQVQRASGRRSDRHNRHHQHRQRHTPAEPQRPRHQRQARHGHPSRPRPAAAATPPEVSNRPQPRLPRACNTHPQDGSTRRDLRCLGGAHHRTAAVPGVRVARPRAGSWAADHHPALLGQWPSVHLPGHHLAVRGVQLEDLGTALAFLAAVADGTGQLTRRERRGHPAEASPAGRLSKAPPGPSCGAAGTRARQREGRQCRSRSSRSPRGPMPTTRARPRGKRPGPQRTRPDREAASHQGLTAPPHLDGSSTVVWAAAARAD